MRYIKSRKSSLVYEISKTLAEVYGNTIQIQNALKSQFLNMNNVCEYCEHNHCGNGKGDHFRPLVKHQMPTEYCNEPINMIPVCTRCNSSKGSQDFFEWYTNSKYCQAFSSNVRSKVLKKMRTYNDVFEEHHTRKIYPHKKVEKLINELDCFLEQFEEKVRAVQKETQYFSSTNFEKKMRETNPHPSSESSQAIRRSPRLATKSMITKPNIHDTISQSSLRRSARLLEKQG
jgi:hypothetical protein